MILRQGDMWSAFERADLFCITTNHTLKKDGTLVMGGGMAKQAAQRFPDLPRIAGEGAALCGAAGHLFLPLPALPPFALFQTKWDWRENSDILTIERSADLLQKWCLDFQRKHRRSPEVHLNFPGIGLGKLNRKDVLRVLEYHVPDCVTVWEIP